MRDQANFIVTQPKSSDPSPKRINNIDPLGGSIVYVCAWEYGCVCAGWGGGEGTGLQAARMNIYH